MDADANMSFVHGRTAHMACCEACAKQFKAHYHCPWGEPRSDTDDDDVPHIQKCPVCRQEIDLIVQNFSGLGKKGGMGRKGRLTKSRNKLFYAFW